MKSPVLQMRGIDKAFGGVKALDGVDFRLLPGRGSRAHGRERRRQEHADEGAHRRVLARRGRDRARRERRSQFALRWRPSAPASARSTRRSTSAPTSRWRRTSPSAASRAGSAGSTGAPCAAARPRRSRASTSTSTSRPLLGGYSLAVQQMVAIARAIDISAKVLILDEPTSSLDQRRGGAALRRDAAR